jgi:molybdenum cofactor guanylyltransferase
MQNIYGLVVCGGRSSRMGTDKSLLDYHGKPQRYYLYDLLTKITGKVFISCNKSQSEEIPAGYNFIVDAEKYRDTGPMAALLSAFEQYPDASFLVVGCDYPFITKNDLIKLLKDNDSEWIASAYYNEKENFYEPLLGFYKNSCTSILKEYFDNGNYSINNFLKNIQAPKIMPSTPEIIKSADTFEDYQSAKARIGNSPNFPQL